MVRPSITVTLNTQKNLANLLEFIPATLPSIASRAQPSAINPLFARELRMRLLFSPPKVGLRVQQPMVTGVRNTQSRVIAIATAEVNVINLTCLIKPDPGRNIKYDTERKKQYTEHQKQINNFNSATRDDGNFIQ